MGGRANSKARGGVSMGFLDIFLFVLIANLASCTTEQAKVAVTNSRNQQISLHRQTDHDYFWLVETKSGYSVILLPSRYEYAYRNIDGKLAASGLIVGAAEPADHGLRVGISPSQSFLNRVNEKEPDSGPQRVAPSPRPVIVRQPDGSEVELTLAGNRDYNWYETKDRYAVMHLPERYEYAIRGADGGLKSTGLEVGTVSPAKHGLLPNIRPSQQFLMRMQP